MSISRIHNFPLIGVFRFVAASLVLLVHLGYIFQVNTLWEIFAPAAVSWFFIVSGFILSHRYPHLTLNSLKHFYVARFAKIYPAYFVGLMIGVVFLALGYAKYGHAIFQLIGRLAIGTYDLPKNLMPSDFLVATAKHIVFLQFFSSIESIKYLFNAPLWSIVNEIFFYLLFPLLLPVAAGFRSIRTILLALIICYGAQYVLIQLFLPTAEHLDWFTLNTPIYTNPLVRVMEFCMGLLLYRLSLAWPLIQHKWKGWLILATALALYLLSAAAVGNVV